MCSDNHAGHRAALHRQSLPANSQSNSQTAPAFLEAAYLKHEHSVQYNSGGGCITQGEDMGVHSMYLSGRP